MYLMETAILEKMNPSSHFILPLAWLVFSTGIAIKLWHLGILLRAKLTRSNNNYQMFRESLERNWLKSYQKEKY
jgi:hypothetical protein